MSANRQGENGQIPFRNGRLHCIDDQWFYATRGPELHGPYPSPEEAEAACVRETGQGAVERPGRADR